MVKKALRPGSLRLGGPVAHMQVPWPLG